MVRRAQIKKWSTIILCSLLLIMMISLEACTQEKPQPSSQIFSSSGPRLMYLHRSANYKIAVFNVEKESKKAGKVTTTITQEFEFISAGLNGVFTPAGENTLASVVWQLGDVAPGGKVEIELKLRGKARGRARIDSKLTFSEATLRTATLETKIIGVPAMHISSYDTEDPVEIGKQTIYVIEAQNEGTSPCTNVTLESKIPKEMEFVSAEGPEDFKHNAGLIHFEPFPILHPGEKLTYKVVCKALKAGSAKHTATLTFDQFEQPLIDEEGTSCYE